MKQTSIYILRCPDGRGLVYTSLSEAVNACQIEGILSSDDYQIEQHGYDPVNCSDLGIEVLYNVYGVAIYGRKESENTVEKLREAVALIKDECKKHTMCSNCPLFHITCERSINYPASWPAEKIGVEDIE